MMPPGADFSEEQLAIAADFHYFNYAFCQEQAFDVAKGSAFPVSYTHLTLPTILLV